MRNFANVDCTLLVGVDDVHVNELATAWRTWALHKPEVITNRPVVFVCDGEYANEVQWASLLIHKLGMLLSGIDYRIVLERHREGQSQREKMLTGLVRAVEHVETPWYLKLDTDTIAVDSREWFIPKLLEDNGHGLPCFLSSPWGYTKPPEYLTSCDKWASGRPFFTGTEPMFAGEDMSGETFAHHRIISYVFIGNTEWTKRVAADVFSDSQRLPCPSQDTFLWYVAARTQSLWRTFKFKSKGWSHGHTALRAASKEIGQ